MNEPARTGHQYQMLVGLVAGQVLFAALFVFLLLSAYHQPTPHTLPVGVAAPQAVTGSYRSLSTHTSQAGLTCGPIPTPLEPVRESSPVRSMGPSWSARADSVC